MPVCESISNTGFVLALPESEDRVPSAPERFAAIDKRIDALRDEIHAITKPESWLVRAYRFAINHKAFSAVLAIILCLAGIFGGGYFRWWLDHRQDGFNSAVDGRIRAVLVEPGGVQPTLSDIEKKVDKANTTLDTLQPFIQDVIKHQFESVSKLSTQTLIERIPSVRTLLAAAKDEGVHIDPRIIADTGGKYVEASGRNHAAWGAALGFLNYKSFLNSLSTSIPMLTGKGNYDVYFNLPWDNRWPRPQVASSFAAVPRQLAAQSDFIGKDFNEGKPTGPALLVVSGGSAILDGLQLRHVVFRNTHILYSGGPLRMTDVYFVDCVFEMPTAKNTQGLAVAALDASPSINFNGE
jgi:hypothetical protein